MQVIVEICQAFLEIMIAAEVVFWRYKKPEVNELSFTDEWLRLIAYSFVTVCSLISHAVVKLLNLEDMTINDIFVMLFR